MKMKIPSAGSGNGYYGHETSLGYGSDTSENGHHEELDSPALNGDFSEYMWMEHEEEFDKEIMQQLEEEALMEQCFEAMLEDEREIQNMSYMFGDNGSSASSPSAWNGTTEGEKNTLPMNGVNLCDKMESLQVKESSEMVKQSTLNPDAAEFVPQQRNVATQQEENSS